MSRFERITQHFAQELQTQQAALDAAASGCAYEVEPRPVPEGLDPKPGELPLGHIAFQGDFDQPNSTS